LLYQELKKKYSLCNYCFDRQLAGVRKYYDRSKNISSTTTTTTGNNNPNNSCDICHGIMSQLDSITEKICCAVEGGKYEFNSFLLGGTLPSATFDREDSIRAQFKIRGRENVKKQFINELRRKFKKITGKKVEHILPDIIINVVIDDQGSTTYQPITISVRSSPLFLTGRYVKRRRGLSQKKDKCQKCSGIGCVSCGHVGASSLNSVEAIIASRMLEITRGENPKFSWLGGEDKYSLVLGKGRPFLLSISNPKSRSLKGGDLKIEENGVCAVIRQQAKSQLPSRLPAHFITKTRITIQTEDDLSNSKNLGALLLGALENSEVTFKSKSKIVRKKIYSLKVRQVDKNKFVLTINADGGLLIKQFVEGQEYFEPNISNIIGTKCKCTGFDILDVKTQSDFWDDCHN
jgi:tRNA pseudouridine synthase 10